MGGEQGVEHPPKGQPAGRVRFGRRRDVHPPAVAPLPPPGQLGGHEAGQKESGDSGRGGEVVAGQASGALETDPDLVFDGAGVGQPAGQQARQVGVGRCGSGQ